VESGVNEFRGVAFDMSAGAIPQITVVGKSGMYYRALIYGPQTVQGLWGRVLHEVSGIDSVVISTWEAPQSGHYLILALPRPGLAFDYTVSIECEGCGLDRCQAETPCNSYCPQGRVIDAGTGCTTCECAGASCVAEGCLEDNEICVFRCGEDSCAAGQTCMRGRCLESSCEAECGDEEACFEGECQLARYECAAAEAICEEACPPLRDPVCAEVDGGSRTVPNRCLAECLSASRIDPGPCEPSGCQGSLECADGEECEAGTCVPQEGCPCDDEPDMPVCGENMGVRRTFRNACEMNCARHQLEYEGTCIIEPLCDTSLDCRVSERCIALPDARIAGNEGRCEVGSDSEGCIRACINRQRCRQDDECGSKSVCVIGSDVGLCMPVCGEAADCENGESCSTRLRDPIGMSMGVCLTKCGDDNTCHDAERCSTLDSVCLPCDRCDLAPGIPLCYDGSLYENGCELLCRDVRTGTTLPMPPVSVELETCNGLDDDCDGQTDEGLLRECQRESAECRGGQQSCIDGVWSACEPVFNQRMESCNGLDDDCDGQTDEGLSRLCQRESAECRSGRQRCIDAEWSECEPVANREVELCNGLDDDCDGAVDEPPVVLPAGATSCLPEVPDCNSCPTTWTPVCTERGLAPNRCFADCHRLAIKPNSECGFRESPVSRCVSDDDCMRSRCITPGQSVCGGADLELSCAQYHSSGVCFERSADCRCDLTIGTCGFKPTPDTNACLGIEGDFTVDDQPGR